MEVEAVVHEQVVVVAVKGSLDALTAPQLGTAFTEQIESGHIRLVADLEGLEYTSSAGLRVLLAAVKATRRKGGDLRLAGVQDGVNKVLSLAGFNNIVKGFPDVQTAVASFADSDS